MEVTDYMGPLSLLPASIAIVLAFVTRNTVFSLAAASSSPSSSTPALFSTSLPILRSAA